jgi:DnaJ-class molecular chaperone
MSKEETAFMRLLRKVFNVLRKGQPCPRCRGTGGTAAEVCRDCNGTGFL